MEGSINLQGSILIVFKQINFTSTTDLFRLTFNTAFIGQRNYLKLSRWEISPENNHKDFSKFPEDFQVEIWFDNGCKGQENSGVACKAHTTPISELCYTCKEVMREEIVNWNKAMTILDAHNLPSINQAKQILPHNEEYVM